jgi:hypothetical protein
MVGVLGGGTRWDSLEAQPASPPSCMDLYLQARDLQAGRSAMGARGGPGKRREGGVGGTPAFHANRSLRVKM